MAAPPPSSCSRPRRRTEARGRPRIHDGSKGLGYHRGHEAPPAPARRRRRLRRKLHPLPRGPACDRMALAPAPSTRTTPSSSWRGGGEEARRPRPRKPKPAVAPKPAPRRASGRSASCRQKGLAWPGAPPRELGKGSVIESSYPAPSQLKHCVSADARPGCLKGCGPALVLEGVVCCKFAAGRFFEVIHVEGARPISASNRNSARLS